MATLTPPQQAIHDDAKRAMSAVAISMAEFYSNVGKWPDSNTAAGLPEPDAFRGKSLERLDAEGPVVTLTFDSTSGIYGGKVVYSGTMTPQMVMGIQWRCTSPTFRDIAVAIADCTYSGQ